MDTKISPRAAELLAELPEELHGPVSRDEELRQLLRTLSTKPVPTGRLFRMWSLGSLQARIAAAYLAYWIRSGFAGEEKKSRLRREVHLKAAVRLLASMGYLRGAIMKMRNGSSPRSISRPISSRVETICRHSSSVSNPTEANICVWAFEARISTSASRESKLIDSVNDSTRGSVFC